MNLTTTILGSPNLEDSIAIEILKNRISLKSTILSGEIDTLDLPHETQISMALNLSYFSASKFIDGETSYTLSVTFADKNRDLFLHEDSIIHVACVSENDEYSCEFEWLQKRTCYTKIAYNCT